MITGAGFFCISFYIKSFPQQILIKHKITVVIFFLFATFSFCEILLNLLIVISPGAGSGPALLALRGLIVD